jgi:hypothetical protein
VKLPVLAKLMLAERFIPRLFDQIAMSAASDPKGICTDLVRLEEEVSNTKEQSQKPTSPAEVKGPSASKAESKPEAVKAPDSAQLTEWTSSQAVRSWAKIEPAIGASDLRPYLFVAKDRKDYFGATTVLGQLASVAEKLLGSKFVVQGLETEVRQLAIPEAAQVLDLVRARIVGGDTFDTEPAGAAGIAVLVRRAALLSTGDSTKYALSDLTARELDTRDAQGQQIRSFQYAIEKLRQKPKLAALYIHKPGPLSDESPTRQAALAGVYKRGLAELAKLLAGVRAAPS